MAIMVLSITMVVASGLLFLLLICPGAVSFAPPAKTTSRLSCDDDNNCLFRLAADADANNNDLSNNDNSGEPFMDGGSDLLKNILSNDNNYLVDQNKARVYSGAMPGQDLEVISQTLDNWIQEYPILMLSMTECPYCKKAKSILKEKRDDSNVRYHVIELDQIDIGGAIRQEYTKRNDGRSSVPAIWINGQFIGGCNDGAPGLIPLIDSGEFEKMIAK